MSEQKFFSRFWLVSLHFGIRLFKGNREFLKAQFGNPITCFGILSAVNSNQKPLILRDALPLCFHSALPFTPLVDTVWGVVGFPNDLSSDISAPIQYPYVLLSRVRSATSRANFLFKLMPCWPCRKRMVCESFGKCPKNHLNAILHSWAFLISSKGIKGWARPRRSTDSGSLTLLRAFVILLIMAVSCMPL